MKIVTYLYFDKYKILKTSEIIVENNIELKNYLTLKNKMLIKIITSQKHIKIKRKDQDYFFYSTGKLLKSGIPLKKCLELQVENSKNRVVKAYYKRIIWKLDLGEDIFSILKADNILSKSEELLVYVFENSGDLSDGFFKINNLRDRRDKLKKEIITYLIYPLLILVLSTIIIILMLIFIVPNFVEIYESTEIELPLVTRIIIGFADLFRKTLYVMVILFFSSFFFIKKLLKNRLKILRIPYIGKWIINKFVIDILESLALLLDSGFSLEKSIDVILEGISRKEIKDSFSILKEIKMGDSISEVLSRTNLLSNIEINMIKIGEEGGDLSKMLKDISFMKKEIHENKLKIFLKLLEPILLLIIGLIISFFIIGLYLPILNMSETIL
ncbi:type II secretion system F family protein [uncultured Cetobacterium sp.]|uniref:type II secretion system F family protein n=1 Tax=uncultured Cetobacterium sp. TaxID=527638 RepID=UPI002638FEE0|nr:type II secretion system F family protein [uncultured Cetobacterium sp.]